MVRHICKKVCVVAFFTLVVSSTAVKGRDLRTTTGKINRDAAWKKAAKLAAAQGDATAAAALAAREARAQARPDPFPATAGYRIEAAQAEAKLDAAKDDQNAPSTASQDLSKPGPAGAIRGWVDWLFSSAPDDWLFSSAPVPAPASALDTGTATGSALSPPTPETKPMTASVLLEENAMEEKDVQNGKKSLLHRGASEHRTDAKAEHGTKEAAGMFAQAERTTEQTGRKNRQAAPRFSEGDRVVAHGLQNRADCNGKAAEVTKLLPGNVTRYVVKFDEYDEPVRIKESNLKAEDAEPAAAQKATQKAAAAARKVAADKAAAAERVLRQKEAAAEKAAADKVAADKEAAKKKAAEEATPRFSMGNRVVAQKLQKLTKRNDQAATVIGFVGDHYRVQFDRDGQIKTLRPENLRLRPENLQGMPEFSVGEAAVAKDLNNVQLNGKKGNVIGLPTEDTGESRYAVKFEGHNKTVRIKPQNLQGMPRFYVGEDVVAQDLNSAYLNGKRGTVIELPREDSGGRYAVKFDNETVRIRPQNLQALEETAAEKAAAQKAVAEKAAAEAEKAAKQASAKLILRKLKEAMRGTNEEKLISRIAEGEAAGLRKNNMREANDALTKMREKKAQASSNKKRGAEAPRSKQKERHEQQERREQYRKDARNDGDAAGEGVDRGFSGYHGCVKTHCDGVYEAGEGEDEFTASSCKISLESFTIARASGPNHFCEEICKVQLDLELGDGGRPEKEAKLAAAWPVDKDGSRIFSYYATGIGDSFQIQGDGCVPKER